jgi:hypothetical protein
LHYSTSVAAVDTEAPPVKISINYSGVLLGHLLDNLKALV